MVGGKAARNQDFKACNMREGFRRDQAPIQLRYPLGALFVGEVTSKVLVAEMQMIEELEITGFARTYHRLTIWIGLPVDILGVGYTSF